MCAAALARTECSAFSTAIRTELNAAPRPVTVRELAAASAETEAGCSLTTSRFQATAGTPAGQDRPRHAPAASLRVVARADTAACMSFIVGAVADPGAAGF